MRNYDMTRIIMGIEVVGRVINRFMSGKANMAILTFKRVSGNGGTFDLMLEVVEDEYKGCILCLDIIEGRDNWRVAMYERRGFIVVRDNGGVVSMEKKV